MGTFNEDNRIGAFRADDVKRIYRLHTDGDISAEQALHAIAIEAGVIGRSARAAAFGDLVQKVSRGELPVSALLAVIDEVPEAKCTYCGAPLHRADSVSKWEDAKGSPFCPAEGQQWHGAEPADVCSECGNVISSSHPSMANADHAESCSLYVDEGLASERATRKARGDIGWEG